MHTPLSSSPSTSLRPRVTAVGRAWSSAPPHPQKENEDEEEKDQVYCTDPTRRATYEGKARLGRLVARVRAMQRYKMARGPNATKNSEGSFPHTGLQLNYRRSVVVMLCCEWSYPTQGEASIVGAVENTWSKGCSLIPSPSCAPKREYGL